MLDPFSMVGNGSNVRGSPVYSNPAPSQPIIQSYRRPGNGVTLSNSGCNAHDIATLDEIKLSQQLVNAVGNSSFHNDVVSMPQPHISGDPTDGFEPGNNFFNPIAYPYQEDTINEQTVPQARYLDPLFENSLTESPARYMQAIPGGPKTGFQLSVGAPFQTPGQNNLASPGDESSVPPLVIGYRRFSPNPHLRNNLHGINIQHVLDSEEIEQIHAQSKTKHVVGVPSPFLPRYTWCYTSEESGATSTQSQKDLPSTHQPWTSFRDESSSQQGSSLGQEASPTPSSKVHRSKRSPAVTERKDPQEAMSQILDSQMLPTKPPRRRSLTEGERRRVAHVRRMKACPSCRRKHQKCNHVPDANPDSHSLTPESTGPDTPPSDTGAFQIAFPGSSPSYGL